MDRRDFLTLAGTALASGTVLNAAVPLPARAADAPAQPQTFYRQQQQFRIGFTTNTRGGWEGDPFKGFSEARDVGFRYVEVFGASFCALPAAVKAAPGEPPHVVYYPDDVEGLMHRIYQIGVNFVAVTGAPAGSSTAFEDPAQRAEVVQGHFDMARFSRRFGCDHQKTNLGRRRPEGTTDADLKQMAITCNELGKRINGELGMKFGIHPHLGSQLQTEHETVYMMENTDPQFVNLVLDTGHFTMAGMDPLAMAKKYGLRIIEFHFKDTKPEDRGGTKNVPPPTQDQMKEPYFLPLGSGGVDFPGIMDHLRSTEWRGFLNVELDASPWREPKDSAKMCADYLRNTLKLEM